MKLVSALALGALLLGAGVAAAQDVRYNYDKSANFGQFKTYAWVAIKDAARVSDLVDKQIKDAVDAQLTAKGLSKVDSPDKADLLVAYQAGVQKEKEFTSYNSGWGAGPGWYGGGWYGGGGMTTTTGSTSTIYIGQLVIDLYSAQAKTLVFRSVGSKTLDTDAKPDKQQKNLTKAVKKMMKNYPTTPATQNAR